MRQITVSDHFWLVNATFVECRDVSKHHFATCEGKERIAKDRLGPCHLHHYPLYLSHQVFAQYHSTFQKEIEFAFEWTLFFIHTKGQQDPLLWLNVSLLIFFIAANPGFYFLSSQLLYMYHFESRKEGVVGQIWDEWLGHLVNFRRSVMKIGYSPSLSIFAVTELYNFSSFFKGCKMSCD